MVLSSNVIFRTTLSLIALLSIGGGIEGFVAKGSKMSLIGGCVIGILMFLGVWQASRQLTLSLILGCVGCLLLLGQFGVKAVKTGVVWPAGAMTVAAVAGLAVIIYAFLQTRTSPSSLP